MIDIQNLFGAFSSSRQRAASNPPVPNRFMERSGTVEEAGMPPYPYQGNFGGGSGNGGTRAPNVPLLPPFPPSINRASNREPLPNQSITFNTTSQPTAANNKNLARIVNGNISYSSNPQNHSIYNTLQANTTSLNNTKMYSVSQPGGGIYNTISSSNMPPMLHPNSLYLSNRCNSQFVSPIILPPYQNFSPPNVYFPQGGGMAPAPAPGTSGKMQKKLHDYLSMTYAGAGGRNMQNSAYNNLPISRTIQVNRSELLPMRLIGDVVYKNVNLGNFVGEGGAIMFYLLGEQIRHEYKSLSMVEWEAEKSFLKETTQIPIYKPPVLLHDNVTLYDTVSILRYLSKKMGQYGCDHLKDFVMDAISAVLLPWRTILDKAIFASIKECEDSNNSFVTYLHERRTWYARFEELLDSYIRKMRDMQIQHIVSNREENGSVGGWRDEKFNSLKEFDTFFTGKKPAFCDYILFSILFDDIKLLQDVKSRKNKEDKRKIRQAKEERLEKEENEDDEISPKEGIVREEEESEISNEIVPTYFLSQCPRLLCLYDELKSHPHIEQFMIQLEESNKSDNNEQENSNESELNYSNNNSCNSENESVEENNEAENLDMDRNNNNLSQKKIQANINNNNNNNNNDDNNTDKVLCYPYYQNMNNPAVMSNAFMKSNVNHMYNPEYINAFNKSSASPPPASYMKQKMILGNGMENVCVPNPSYDTLSMTYGGGGTTDGMYNYFSQPIPHFFHPQASFNPYLNFVNPCSSVISEPHAHDNVYIPSVSAAYANHNPHEYMTTNNYNNYNNLSALRVKQGGLRVQKLNPTNKKMEEQKNSTVVTTTASTTHVENHLTEKLH